jgi:hypothetical protein
MLEGAMTNNELMKRVILIGIPAFVGLAALSIATAPPGDGSPKQAKPEPTGRYYWYCKSGVFKGGPYVDDRVTVDIMNAVNTKALESTYDLPCEQVWVKGPPLPGVH